MFRYLLVLIVLCLTVAPEADDLADLLWKFRQRIGEDDTAYSNITDTAAMLFLDQAQDKVVPFGGFLPKRVDVTFSFDSLQYGLPSDFKMRQTVMVRYASQWHTAIENPGFMRDTTSFQYYIGWEHPDQAEIYLKGREFYNGATIRVHYLAVAPNMVARTDSCYVPEALQTFIIEEAVGYFEWMKRDKEGFGLMNQAVRQDMGINLQGKK